VAAVTPSYSSSDHIDPGWVFSLTYDDLVCMVTNDSFDLLVDTGSVETVCPLAFAEDVKMLPMGVKPQLRDVSGGLLKIAGQRQVPLLLGVGSEALVGATVTFVVAAIRLPILSVGKMIEVGSSFVFEPDGSYMEKNSVQVPLQPLGRVFVIRCRRKFESHNGIEVAHGEHSSTLSSVGIAQWQHGDRPGPTMGWTNEERPCYRLATGLPQACHRPATGRATGLASGLASAVAPIEDAGRKRPSGAQRRKMLRERLAQVHASSAAAADEYDRQSEVDPLMTQSGGGSQVPQDGLAPQCRDGGLPMPANPPNQQLNDINDTLSAELLERRSLMHAIR
jgi:hypothetical protein